MGWAEPDGVSGGRSETVDLSLSAGAGGAVCEDDADGTGVPVGCLRLTANFRSQRELVEEFNEEFSLLFPREVDAASPEEVPYAPAVAVNGPSGVAAARGFVWHTEVLAAGEGVQGKRRI